MEDLAKTIGKYKKARSLFDPYFSNKFGEPPIPHSPPHLEGGPCPLPQVRETTPFGEI